jgi:hypothetical protein
MKMGARRIWQEGKVSREMRKKRRTEEKVEKEKV